MNDAGNNNKRPINNVEGKKNIPDRKSKLPYSFKVLFFRILFLYLSFINA